MTKRSIAISLALIVAIMPFLGFSTDIKELYYTAAGVIIAALIHLSSIHYCGACREKIENGEHDKENEESEEVLEVPEDDMVAVEMPVKEEPKKAPSTKTRKENNE